LLLLWHLMGRWLPPLSAIGLPLVFLVGTNWLFYTVVHAGWAHAVAVFWTTVVIWAAMRRLERRDMFSALLFGSAGGALFTTRNLGAIAFLTVAVFVIIIEIRDRRHPHGSITRDLAAAAGAAIGFAVFAAPQLCLFALQHGSPLRASVAAAVDALKPFGFPGGVPGPYPYLAPSGVGPFEPLSPGNLAYLASNLFNLENGLFVSHPLFLVGVLGAVVCRPAHRAPWVLMAGLGLATYVSWFVDAAYFDTWFNRAAGSGFGERRFLDLLPFFLMGTALLWAHARTSRWGRRIAALAIATACAYGVVLFQGFVHAYERLQEAKAAMLDLLTFVLFDWRTGVVALVVLLILLADARVGRTPFSLFAGVMARRPQPIAVFAAALALPMLVFRPTPEWERQRLLERRGFFALYSPAPYVSLSSSQWGEPDNSGREMRLSTAAIGLPAPLRAGDVLLLRLDSSLDPAMAPKLEVRLGDDLVGRTPLLPHDHVYAFPVDRVFSRPKDLAIMLTPPETQSPRRPQVRAVEGRVLLRGADDPPFGMIGPRATGAFSTAGDPIVEGWALDDRGLARVFAEVVGGPMIADATFADVTWPDVADIYKLYSGIMKNWWRIRLAPGSHPSSGGHPVLLRVVAEDFAGQRTTIGTCVVSLGKPASAKAGK
jgi:hypothetical protein